MKVPHTSRLQTTDRHHNHQLTQAHSPLSSHLNQKLSPATNAAKIKTATSQNRMPQCIPGFSSSQTFTSSSTGLLSPSDHHTEEYLTIWCCAAVYLLMNLFLKTTHKQRWNIPVAFHIFDQLDQPRYRLPIATPIYWQSGSPQTFLPRFTTRATNMVNYSLSKDLLFPQLKHGVELEAGRNVCIAAQCLDTRATAAIVFTIKRPKQANSHM